MPSASGTAGRVAGLARFPVKSTAGEEPPRLVVDDRGAAGDRRWAVYTEDGRPASGKTTGRFRRVPGLGRWRSGLPDAGPPVLYAPDGSAHRAGDPATDRALSADLGRPLTTRAEHGDPHFDDSPVHVITTGGLRWLRERVGADVDPARFRANVLVDTDGEDVPERDWCGALLRLGPDVVLRLGPPMERCVMVDRPPGGAGPGPKVLATLGRHRDVRFGWQAEVVRTGVVAVRDPVTVARSVLVTS